MHEYWKYPYVCEVHKVTLHILYSNRAYGELGLFAVLVLKAVLIGWMERATSIGITFL